MSQSNRLICLTLPGYPDPSMAIAASRSGALGVLDLEYGPDIEVARAALGRLARFAKGDAGVKIDLSNTELAAALMQGLPPEIQTLVIARPCLADLPGQVAALQQDGRRVLVEATDAATAAAAAAAGAAGVILKGNEAGGRVGEETAFVLFQRCIARVDIPLWVQGGIGVHAAAACIAGGAAGIVLDWQLALTRESPLPHEIRERLASMDGSETITLGGGPLVDLVRVYTRPGLPAVEALFGAAAPLLGAPTALLEARSSKRRAPSPEPRAPSEARPSPERSEAEPERSDAVTWRETVARQVVGACPEPLLLVGQEATFAADLAGRHVTVGGIVRAIETKIADHLRTARAASPLDEHGPLAVSHGTRYPILQGPMTRVSDVASFCEAVGAGGALPFLALALMRAPQVEALLQETKERMGERPWGVGILGFVPLDLRQEQLEVVRRYQPRFAIIAGGRPDQAARLEQDGIATYLHVPSPGLLALFLGNGARRFIFEGRECGGHVGPRSSFVLWQSMIDVLTSQIDAGQVEGAACHVVFAGGIHDARSAAMVAVLASPLTARGVKIGVLMGTAYLFTEEAVECGAIAEQFQLEALQCDRTVLLETGPGHAIRCFDTPFVAAFQREKERLLDTKRPHEEVRAALEELNLGRLRIASKGIKRHAGADGGPDRPRYLAVSAEEQRSEGMYMSGQIAALRDRTTTIEELHREVAAGGTAFLKAIPAMEAEESVSRRPCDVAIIGMSTLLPKAPTLRQYWENILSKVDAIEEVPTDRWDPADYFDPDRLLKKDRVYSQWGGFLDPIPFDPVAYGMPPNSIRSIEPLQLLTLEVARAALSDAGYGDQPFDRERTSIILGAGGGAADLGQLYGFRSTLPMFFGKYADPIVDQLGSALPEWSEDSFAGILMNVAAGRVANRLDLGGANFTVDAACASSLAAVYLGVRELEAGVTDMVLVGGVDAMQGPFAYVAFSKTQALSPRGRCRTFDESADGIAISEGLAMLVLKRLEDAERDGDRIYAVIKGIGASSDGRDKGLTAPRPEGQIRALERAYTRAGVSPATVELIEAHGTGTVAGDRAEVTALTQFFARWQAERQSCAIGSVKSMIGHTKCTAGVAGLIKAALAVYEAVLPPTLGVEKPNSHADFPETPFYVNSETRPWLRRPDGEPRRAGVSAFGFGGTNFHVVLEEYTGSYLPSSETTLRNWPSELFLWEAPDRAGLLAGIQPVERALAAGATPLLAELALTVCSQAARGSWLVARGGDGPALTTSHEPRDPASLGARSQEAKRLAIVAHSLEDLGKKLAAARTALADADRTEIVDPTGIFFSDRPLAREGRLAFLFPGQGSQYPDMGRDLALRFGEALASYEQADAILADRYERPLSTRIFPPPTFTDEEAKANRKALTDTHVAQPALGAMAMATCAVLRTLGVTPAMAAGHSYGEFAALWAAGVFDDETLLRLSEARGRFMRDRSESEPGAMAAVEADAATVIAALDGVKGVVCANLNAPRQTVIAGARASVEQAVAAFDTRGIRARPLPVACAFHSPLVAAARDDLAAVLAEITARPPSIPVYSNTTGGRHEEDPDSILALLAEHVARPVEFLREIEAMYDDGARIFVEVGPKGVLTGLVGQILAGRSHVAVTTDQEGRSGLHQLLLALARLAAEGVDVTTGRLFAHRGLRPVDLNTLGDPASAGPVYTPTTWLVNGTRAIPARDAGKPLPSLRVNLTSLVTNGSGSGGRLAERPGGGAECAGAPPRSAPSTHASPGYPARPIGSAPRPVGGREANANGNAAGASAPAPGGGSMTPTPNEVSAVGHPQGAPLQADGHAPAPQTNGLVHPAQEPLSAPIRGRGETTPPQERPNAEAVVTQFQQVMSRFLDTQRAVMLAYLGGATAAAAPPEQVFARPVLPAHPMPASPPGELAPAGFPQERPTGLAPGARHQVPGPEVAGQPASSPPGVWSLEPGAGTAGAQDMPVVESATAVPDPVAAAPAVTRESVTEELLTIVAERTGYPTEMLGLDLDLEADLGIDSIKRVEILGTFQRQIGEPAGQGEAAMEELARIKSLRGIIDWVLEQQGGRLPTGDDDGPGAGRGSRAPAEGVPSPAVRPPPEPPSAAALGAGRWALGGDTAGGPATTGPDAQRPAPSAASGSEPGISRSRVVVAPAPPADPSAGLAPGGVLLVTDDGRGIATALARRCGESGLAVALVRVGSATAEVEPGVYTCPFQSPEGIQALAAAVRARQGAVAAIIHLLPARPAPALDCLDLPWWRERLAEDVGGLFHLAQAFGPDLHAAAQRGGAAVLAVTGMGGAFGLDGATGSFAGSGGVAGLTKTLALEWPDVRVRAIDIDPGEVDRSSAPARPRSGFEAPVVDLLAELYNDGTETEIGYGAGGRQTLCVEPAPLAPSDGGLAIDPSSVILLTGGARGITAEVALHLARSLSPRREPEGTHDGYPDGARPTLLLAGRSPHPESCEDPETASLQEPRELKAAIAARMQGEGRDIVPIQVEQEYRRLLHAREMRQTLRAIEDAGATARYFPVDMRDESAVRRFLETVYGEYGRLDGVVHGAGIIEDKLIEQKDPASFRRVFETKTDSAFLLARWLRFEQLRFLVFFSSVSGRFGNRGQGDYAAANEVLNKLAYQLDRLHATRVVAIDWGPWAMGGMVSPELQRRFEEQGVLLIPRDQGARMFDEEIRWGRKGEAEVVVSGGAVFSGVPRAARRVPRGDVAGRPAGYPPASETSATASRRRRVPGHGTGAERV